jgi:hypothetical protein
MVVGRSPVEQRPDGGHWPTAPGDRLPVFLSDIVVDFEGEVSAQPVAQRDEVNDETKWQHGGVSETQAFRGLERAKTLLTAEETRIDLKSCQMLATLVVAGRIRELGSVDGGSSLGLWCDV